MDRPILTVVVAAATAAITFVAMNQFVAQRLPVHAVEVPPLVGLSPEQARGMLEPRGLLLVLDAEKEDTKVPVGTVCEQTPLGGSRLRRGDLVHAALARAPSAQHVPKVAGLSADAARTLLTDARLKVGRLVDAPSATVPRGMVVDSTPAAGSEVKIESAVDLTLSAGPAAAPVPKVIGKRLSKAKELLEQAGFAVGSTKYGSHDDFDSGVVIGQNPAAGAQATPGVKIDLTIND